MRGPIRFRIVQTLSATIVALAGILSAPAEATSLNSPEAIAATNVLCAYVAAREQHDFEKARVLAADDIRWLDAEGQNHPKNDARLKAMLSWEEAMGAAWSCRAVGFADGWLEAEISERNRMYDALGVGTLWQRDRVRVEAGQLREGRTLAEWSTGRGEDAAFGEFKVWLEKLPAEQREGVIQDGRLIYDGESARRMLPLLDRWEREHPSASSLLAAALDALGGRERIAALDGWIVEGQGRENLSAELQGLSPDSTTWRPHQETVAVLRASGAVAWERKTPRNDQSIRWRRFIEKPDAFGVVDWTAGYGALRASGVEPARRQALMRRIPHLLLLDVATTAKRLIFREERALQGAPHDVIDATVADDTRLSLFLSRNPRRLERVEYSIYVPGLGDSVVAWQWRGWRKSPALGFAPAGHTVEVNGAVFQQVDYRRYETGSEDAARLMEIPANLKSSGGGREIVPPAGPATGEISPGVHVVEIRGFLTMFVEFADFVVVFDAPASALSLEEIPAAGRADCERATEELRAAVARTSPGKPVRFVIVSHHHGDHLGGVRAFAAEPGITFLAAPGDVSSVRRALTAPHTLAPDRWSGDGREVSVEAVPDRRLIADGRRSLEVWRVGENPHTSDNLFAWLPQERLLLQGDLFYYEEGAPFPPSGRETMNRFFAGWLDAHGLAPRAVYGVHYAGAAGPEALARAVR